MLRLFHILLLLARYRMDELLFRQPLSLPKRCLLRVLLSPLLLIPRSGSIPHRMRCLLEHIGPMGIKFGQAVSTRRDMMSVEMADQLGQLQENAPPFALSEVQRIITSTLGAAPAELFERFDETPLASASVSQVHAAQLADGSEVIVKVLRPNVTQLVRRDLRLLKFLARQLEFLLPSSHLLKPMEVVSEYCNAVEKELDLRIEAANTALLGRNFADSNLLYVPKVYWDYCRSEVMVTERIEGVSVASIDLMKQHGVNLKLLAERGLEIFFIQVFETNFFHADMHPGNIYVDISNPAQPAYFALDCAVMGSLSEEDRYYLARNLLAIFQRNYALVAQLHIECGWVSSDVSAIELEEAVRVVCEPVFDRPLGEISFGHLLSDLLKTARRFEAEMQPSLILLQKTLLQVEGLGRSLYPELDMWTIGRPFLEKWLRRRYSPLSFYRQIRDRIPGWLERIPDLPDKLLLAIDNLAQQNTGNQPIPRRQPARYSTLLLLGTTLVLAGLLFMVVLTG